MCVHDMYEYQEPKNNLFKFIVLRAFALVLLYNSSSHNNCLLQTLGYFEIVCCHHSLAFYCTVQVFFVNVKKNIILCIYVCCVCVRVRVCIRCIVQHVNVTIKIYQISNIYRNFKQLHLPFAHESLATLAHSRPFDVAIHPFCTPIDLCMLSHLRHRLYPY